MVDRVYVDPKTGDVWIDAGDSWWYHLAHGETWQMRKNPPHVHAVSYPECAGADQ